jgi:hypothetical protein
MTILMLDKPPRRSRVPSMRSGLILLLAFCLGGVFAQFFLPCGLGCVARTPPLPVAASDLDEGKPDTRITLAERITMPERKPVSVTQAPGAATRIVSAFVEAAQAADSLRTSVRADTTVVEAQPERSGEFVVAGEVPKLIEAFTYRNNHLTLWLAGADGSGFRYEYKDLRSPFQGAVDARGTVTVQSARGGFGWVDDVLKGGIVLLVGVGVGAIAF